MREAGVQLVETEAGLRIKVIKADQRDILAKRDLLLKNLDYMESQIGRLAHMAQEMRQLLKKESA